MDLLNLPPLNTFALYAAVNGLILLFLAIMVVRQRVLTRTDIGDGGKEAMIQVQRAHGNAAEYVPIVLILLYLLGIVAAIEWVHGTFHWERAMRHFMAGFFLVFSFFKLLNLIAFADSYQMYDIIAKQSRAYALAYPFIELLLGLAYLIDFQPRLTNIVTLIVMGVSTIGVVQSILSKKKIRCACLGAVFNLPMSVVTLVEDLLMVGMGLAAGFVGVGGGVSVLSLSNQTYASIAGNVSAGGDVVVRSSDKTSVLMLSGGLGAGFEQGPRLAGAHHPGACAVRYPRPRAGPGHVAAEQPAASTWQRTGAPPTAAVRGRQ